MNKRYTASLCVLVMIIMGLNLKSQTTVFYDNCNTLDNWTNTGMLYPAQQTGFDWLSVDPVVPSDDHTGGGNCFYVNGNQDYPDAGDGNYSLYQLVSDPINLTGFDNTRLEFWMQMRSEQGNWDGGFVEWSHDGITWNQFGSDPCVPYDGNISNNGASIPFFPNLQQSWWLNRTNWTFVALSMAQMDNVPQFFLRFTFAVDELANAKGWAIDDIRIASIAQFGLEGNSLIIPGNNTPLVADNTDFGISAVGAFVDHEFFIHNTGEAPLTLTGTPAVTTTGTGFSIIQQPTITVIPAGDSASFIVRFLPSSSGSFTGTIVIPTSNDYFGCNPLVYNIKGSSPNSPPLISGLQHQTVCPGASEIQIPFTVTDNEQNPAAIQVSGSSANQSLVADSDLVFSGTGTSRVLTISTSGQTGTVILTITANDGQSSSNTSTDTVSITIEDSIPPVAICHNVAVQLDVSGNGSITALQVDSGSTDNCAIELLSISQSEFSCADVGVVSLVFTASDAAGNQSTCSFTATVLPPPGSVELQSPQYSNGKEISCFGLADGTITATAQGGCGPYSYSWNEFPDSVGFQITGVPAGEYSIKVRDSSGQEWTSSITLTEPPPVIGTITMSEACENEVVQLTADSTAFTYDWSTGDSVRSISVSATGIYFVSVTLPGILCAREDTFQLVIKSCFKPLTLPNVFTPNGDAVNEFFKAIESFKYDQFSIFVYTRWGTKVFESEDPFFEWDGKNANGSELPAGTYFCVAKYVYQDKSGELKSSITLIK